MKRKPKWKYGEAGECVICKGTYRNWGNNAQPVSEGRCCEACNWAHVIPARLDDLARLDPWGKTRPINIG